MKRGQRAWWMLVAGIVGWGALGWSAEESPDALFQKRVTVQFSKARASVVFSWFEEQMGYYLANPRNFDKPLTLMTDGPIALRDAYQMVLTACLEHDMYVRLDHEKKTIEVLPIDVVVNDRDRLTWLKDPKPDALGESNELVLAQLSMGDGNAQAMKGLVAGNLKLPGWVVMTPDVLGNRLEVVGTKRQVRLILEEMGRSEKTMKSLQDRSVRYYTVRYLKAAHMFQILQDLLNLKQPVDDLMAAVEKNKEKAATTGVNVGGWGSGGAEPGKPSGPTGPTSSGSMGAASAVAMTGSRGPLQMKSAVGFVPGTSVKIQLYLDERRNVIIALAPPSTVAVIEQLLRQIDVEPLATGDVVKGLPYLKTFNIQYASIGDTVSSLQNLFQGIYMGSAGGGGTLSGMMGQRPTDTSSGVQSSPSAGTSGVPTMAQAAVEGTPQGIVTASVPPYISIIGNNGNNTISVLAENDDLTIAGQYIERVDKDLGQVFIDVLLAEVKLTGDWQFGITSRLNNLLTGQQTGSPTSVEGRHLGRINDTFGFPSPIDSGFFNTVQISSDDVTAFLFRGQFAEALIKLLQKETEFTVLSSPKLAARNNRKASIVFGDIFYTVYKDTESTITKDGIVTGTKTIVTGYAIGLAFSIVPRVNMNGEVALNLGLDITEITGSQVDPAAPPPQSRRTASLNSLVKKGDTLILGGVMRNKKEKSQLRTPILSAIPLIGGLFSSTSESTSKNELLIFLTPHIIDSPSSTKEFMNNQRQRHPLLEWPVPNE